MPRFSISATELTETDVNFVALVKRGANRIPFRITKGDNDMIDLHKIARTMFKKADPVPTVVAAIIQKGADVAAVQAILKSVGIDVSTFEKTERDGLVTLTRNSDDAPEGVMLVKMNDDVALAVAGLQKGFHGFDFSSSDFGEVHATGSFCSSASNATDMLQMTIGNILSECESPGDASTKIAKACDGFKGYLTALTSALPVQAFKADIALLKGAATLLKADMAAPVAGKHPHHGVALAIAHAAHAAASAANQAGTMLGTGDADATDGATSGKGKAMKADAGKNGTGAGFAAGKGTGTDDAASADDKANTEVNAKPGGKVSGAKKAEAIAAATAALAKANGMDDTPEGESAAGEGAAQSTDQDSAAATARASADDKKMKLNGGTTGSTLPEGKDGIPAKLIAKNDGDADIGSKGKGKTLADDESGSGAQEARKADPIMQAIAALSKTVSESIAVVTKDVGSLSARVEAVAVMAKKTDAALNGTVFNETADVATRTQKADNDKTPPLIDTAYSRRSAA